MAFNARVFRILIASPSDVSDEREIAVNTIQAWNDLNSSERQLVLLPLRWETHSAPEYGRRPQEVINRQIVDHCDLLVGIFWTRVGTPSGAADSGTLEEIERVATQGKPVMLYFSQVKQDPDRIELEQLQRLRDFKKKTFPKALVETYTTQIEFRDKLAKQLEIQLRTLLAEENQPDREANRATPTTEIQFEFADAKTGARIGPELEIQTKFIQVEDLEKLPDYEDPKNPASTLTILGGGNKNYYRDVAIYVQHSNFFRPIRFWLTNIGGLGARDVYVDIRINTNETDALVDSLARVNLSPPQEPGASWYGGHLSDRESPIGRSMDHEIGASSTPTPTNSEPAGDNCGWR